MKERSGTARIKLVLPVFNGPPSVSRLADLPMRLLLPDWITPTPALSPLPVCLLFPFCLPRDFQECWIRTPLRNYSQQPNTLLAPHNWKLPNIAWLQSGTHIANYFPHGILSPWRKAMKCQRCQANEARYRVYTDMMDHKVCTSCAALAQILGISVVALENCEPAISPASW